MEPGPSAEPPPSLPPSQGARPAAIPGSAGAAGALRPQNPAEEPAEPGPGCLARRTQALAHATRQGAAPRAPLSAPRPLLYSRPTPQPPPRGGASRKSGQDSAAPPRVAPGQSVLPGPAHPVAHSGRPQGGLPFACHWTGSGLRPRGKCGRSYTVLLYSLQSKCHSIIHLPLTKSSQEGTCYPHFIGEELGREVNDLAQGHTAVPGPHPSSLPSLGSVTSSLHIQCDFRKEAKERAGQGVTWGMGGWQLDQDPPQVPSRFLVLAIWKAHCLLTAQLHLAPVLEAW